MKNMLNSELPPLPKRKRGPKPIGPDAKRTHTVSVRLNAAELDWLDRVRQQVRMARGEYLRSACRGALPVTIPQINRDAWFTLARLCGNLKEGLAQKRGGLASCAPAEAILELLDLVKKMRSELLGIKKSEAEHEVEDQSWW